MANRLTPEEREGQISKLKGELSALAREIFAQKQNIYDFLWEDIVVTRLDYARKHWWSKERLILVLSLEICWEKNAALQTCYQAIKQGEDIDINNFPNIHPNIPKWAITKAQRLKSFKNEIVVLSYQGLFYLFYFEGEEIKLASLASPWDSNHQTPFRAFKTDFKEKAYISQSFPGPMPWSIYLGEWWYFIHMGYTDWTPNSHGCIRLPGIYAKKLFEMIPANAKIPVRIYRD